MTAVMRVDTELYKQFMDNAASSAGSQTPCSRSPNRGRLPKYQQPHRAVVEYRLASVKKRRQSTTEPRAMR